jgi:hypothetical protein
MKEQIVVLKSTNCTFKSVVKITSFLMELQTLIDTDPEEITNPRLSRMCNRHQITSGIPAVLKRAGILSKSLKSFDAQGMTRVTIAVNCVNWSRIMQHSDIRVSKLDYTPIKRIVLSNTESSKTPPYSNINAVKYALYEKPEAISVEVEEVELPKVKDLMAEVVDKLKNDLIYAKERVEFWKEEEQAISGALALVGEAAQAVKTLP